MSEHDHWTSQLELYLDGMLAGESLRAFKRRLNEDDQLQAALKQQRRINAALRQRLAAPQQLATHELFSKIDLNGHAIDGDEVPRALQLPGADSADEAVPSGPVAPPPGAPRTRLPLRRYAIAAGVLLAVVAAWLVWTLAFSGTGQSSEPLFAKEPPRLPFDKYYQRKVNDGFKPAWVCGNDEEFKASFRDRFGQAMLIGTLPESVAMAGLDYNTCLSPHTLSVVMKVNDQGVVVIVDRADRDKGPPDLPQPLNVFRRQLGNLVLYEVTPLDKPGTLDYFYDPDAKSSSTAP
jgi:hypothetical protein